MQAVILAGGRGTRLAERLNGRPKPLIAVDGIPLLERQLVSLSAQGVRDVVLLVNHEAQQIERFVAGLDLPCRVELIDDGAPRGTAGAVLACLDRLEDRFLVVYGDTLFDIDIPHMLEAHEASDADATLLVHPNDHPADSDLVEIGSDGLITRFHPYPHPEGADLQNLVNAAFYVVEKRALEPWCEAAPPLDFAKDLFPRLLEHGARLRGYVSFEYIKDLGTPKRLDKVERHLREGVVDRAARRHRQKAVFVDRDGTLNALRDYVRSAADLELLPGAALAVRRLNGDEYRVIVVTNQPVIARGDTTADGLATIHAKLSAGLGREGAFFDALYYCPHHPDAGFPGEVAELKIACDCRKPGVGMFRKAVSDLNLDLGRSWMIGDSTADMAAAAKLELGAVLVLTGEGGRDGKHASDADFEVDDVAQAAELIVGIYPELAAELAELVASVRPGDLVLAGGPAKSGKSTAAGVLRRELRRRGVPATVVSLDRWICPEPDRSPGVQGRYALEAAESALTPWLAGSGLNASLPTYDRRTRTRGAPSPVRVEAGEVMILEGVPALIKDWRTGRRVHRVHVEADGDTRRRRVVDDLVHRGLASREGAERVFEARLRDEVAPVQAAAGTADLKLTSRVEAAS